ncbi:MAG: heme lyase NrfEFG subunit NrfE [Flavobacteriaceae bacterium]|mgnify:FL=1|jgi:cytochrome c-type biogenesis protein CcmF|nr:heme lyase NrfEFG subunit NrfE [Flavobacteriaceae bacterium]|tara:strand:- start:17074 stop:18966 length:1893 start_codon:yes stop_codon:yes gene_type:complete
MLPEIGNFFLILSFMTACFIFLLSSYAYYFNKDVLDLSRLTFLNTIFILTSFIFLEIAFLSDDFSVLYVASNSNPLLPNYFKFAALWGGHEGSMLLFILILSIWISLFSYFSKYSKTYDKNMVLGFAGLIFLCFSGFTFFSSNPFERLLPIASAMGTDLNPLLQDIAFTIHPPMLYFGYAGLVIPFALALAKCAGVNYAWASNIRTWTILPWSFLTIGIALGSWWAYYELGWGGWWFWDPVENSSLIPWLLSTALIHSAIVSDKRNLFNNWTIMLAILGVIGSFIGMFLVRSGILTSVHTFALDPERGLILLTLTFGITLYAFVLFFRMPKNKIKEPIYSFFSKEFFLLINNALLVILAVIILFGTIYPIIYDIFTGGKSITVGAPYFNAVTVPIAFFLAFFQGYGVLTNWNESKTNNKLYIISFFLVLILSLIFSYFLFQKPDIFVIASYLMFSALVAGLFVYIYLNLNNSKILLNNIGMIFAHAGIAIMILGIGVVSSFSLSTEVIIGKGESTNIGDYNLTLTNEYLEKHSNYYSEIAEFEVIDSSNESAFSLFPEKSYYPASSNVMTESAIRITPKHDLYISLSEKLDSEKWIAKIQIKPFVRLIWLGAILMMLGGFFSIFRKSLTR